MLLGQGASSVRTAQPHPELRLTPRSENTSNTLSEAVYGLLCSGRGCVRGSCEVRIVGGAVYEALG